MDQTSPSTIQQNPVVPPQKSFDLKIILPLIIFVALLSSLGTYFFLQSKNSTQSQSTITPTHYLSNQPYPSVGSFDETENWNTYTPKGHRISFKYPLNWYYLEYSKGQEPTWIIQNYNPVSAPARGYNPSAETKGNFK